MGFLGTDGLRFLTSLVFHNKEEAIGFRSCFFWISVFGGLALVVTRQKYLCVGWLWAYLKFGT